MTVFILGLAIFFAVHTFSALRSREPGKDLKERMGYGPFMGLYSLVSLIGFVLMVYGYGLTRGQGVLYVPPVWMKHLNLALMIPAMILLVASQLPAGRIKKVTKHPMLVAVKLWAVGHLLANGELNAVILFGTFLAYAVFDRIMVKRRGDNGPGDDAVLNANTDIISLVVGIVLWAILLFWLHPILFGVPALPV